MRSTSGSDARLQTRLGPAGTQPAEPRKVANHAARGKALMEEQPDAGRPTVDAAEYDEAYLLCASEGYREFAASRGRRLGPRFRKALSLAKVQAGQRVLDIGCGRGELVIRSACLGAFATGIDYSEAAVVIAREALAGHPPDIRERAAFALMDARRLAFAGGSFDTALMTDVVEHLAPAELAAALSEALRVLRPGGRLVVHTSPNRLLLDRVYAAYTRRVHQALAAACRLVRYRDAVFSPDLPVAPRFPRTGYERRMHINEQTGDSLRAALEGAGFRVERLLYWEPAAYPTRLSLRLRLLDFLRYLRPLSYFPPLNRYFCNHIWAVARRP
jgi:2-polyprenyl-3-methyl-5-hydroxy-6-metoxy-1,4-benzoquinol methylase